MKTKIWINEFEDHNDCEVEFEGEVTHDPEQEGGLETEPLPENWYVENPVWQKDKYTEEENSIIENYVELAGDSLIEMYKTL